MASKLKVLIVGCGHMGAAIAMPIIAAENTIEVTIIDPDVETARHRLQNSAAPKIFNSVSDLDQEKFDAVLVAVKPQMAVNAVADVAPYAEGALIVSIAAGVSIAALSKHAPDDATVIRAMPNLPAKVQKAMTVAYSSDELPVGSRQLVETLFGYAGAFMWVGSEDAVDLATGVAGSGPGYVFAFTEYLQKAAEIAGFSPVEAEMLARQTVIGSARLLEQDGRSAEELKQSVSTPNGTTEAGLDELEIEHALPAILKRAVQAAAARAREISNENQ